LPRALEFRQLGIAPWFSLPRRGTANRATCRDRKLRNPRFPMTTSADSRRDQDQKCASCSCRPGLRRGGSIAPTSTCASPILKGLARGFALRIAMSVKAMMLGQPSFKWPPQRGPLDLSICRFVVEVTAPHNGPQSGGWGIVEDMEITGRLACNLPRCSAICRDFGGTSGKCEWSG
jgi:hypothetical protein